ncbi:MFS transporter [Castellaniella hirudinis]|uniref:MFS transporter n=2 Tax=Castellaniella hirudinis TaxID=1144617 RepID=A0ABV8RU50_9BURK
MNVSPRYQILLLAMTTFVAGANEYILAGILDLVSPGLGVPVELTGQLITLYAFVYGLCVPIVIALTSHIGRRKIMVAAMVIYGLANLMTVWVDDFWTFLPIRVIQALSGGTAGVTVLSTAVSIAGPQRQGRAIATVIMGFTASLIVAVPIGREIALRFGWHAIFPLIGVLSLAAALSQRLALPVLSPAASIPLRAQLALLRRLPVLGGVMVTVLWMAGYVMTYSFLTPYLIEVQHLPSAWVSPVLLVFGVASLAGSQLGGVGTDRLGFYATLVSSKLLQMCFMLALPLVLWFWSPGSVWAVTAVLVMWSVTAWAAGPAQQVRAAALVPEARGVLVGLNQSGMQMGIALGTALGGLVTRTFGLADLPWMSAVMILASLVLMAVCKRMGSVVPAPA